MKRSFKNTLKIGFVIACIMTLFCANIGAASAAYEPPKMPRVFSFKASSTNVTMGETVVLSWITANATSVEIIGLEKTPEEALPLIGSIEVWPLASTSYVLIAKGPGGVVSQTVTVNVEASGDVEIEYFKASSSNILLGETVTLSWKTCCAKSIKIIGLEKEPEETLPLSGTLEVFPMATTTYILQAVGFNGEMVTKTVTVNVNQAKPAKIKYFTASPEECYEGEDVTLSWSVENAKAIAIRDLKTGLAATDSIVVNPTSTTTYVLEAYGYDGSHVTAEVTVNVKEKPVITSFTASATEVSKGQLVTLKWTTENATKCEIVTNDGLVLPNRPANGQISITPNHTRTFTLKAYDGDTVIAEQSITITVK
jgi:hypothetical protein